MSKVAVFGSGSWGTAFSLVPADAGNEVTMWARRQGVCDTINETHQNTDYLPGIDLPQAITATHDPQKQLRELNTSYSRCHRRHCAKT
ncbi:MAG: hypothetical protein R2709_09230 [Marmoricola sp.]